MTFWKIFNNSGDLVKDYFAGIDLQDADFYNKKTKN